MKWIDYEKQFLSMPALFIFLAVSTIFIYFDLFILFVMMSMYIGGLIDGLRRNQEYCEKKKR